LVKLQSKDG